MNKIVQDLKRVIEAIKKTETKAILKMENLGKRKKLQMRTSPTEFRIWKKESQLQMIQ
jgi:hypothetical protein